MRRNLEAEVAEDLRPQSIAQSDIFEPNQPSAPFAGGSDGALHPVRSRRLQQPSSRYGFRFVNGHVVPSARSGSEVRQHYGPSSTNSRKQSGSRRRWRTGSMLIVCPHCTTSYAIDLATLGATGRTVRCSRCKEVWLAHPEDAVDSPAPIPAMAEAGGFDLRAGPGRRMGNACRRRRRRGASHGGQPGIGRRLA